MKNNNSDRAVVKTLRHMEKAPPIQQNTEANSLFSSIGKWLGIPASAPKKAIPTTLKTKPIKDYIDAFTALNQIVEWSWKTNSETKKLLGSLHSLFKHAYEQGERPTIPTLSFLSKEIILRLQKLSQARLEYEAYRQQCNEMISTNYEGIPIGKPFHNYGINLSLERFSKEQKVYDVRNHLQPTFAKLLQEVRQCDKMLKAGQKPEAWPALPPMPAVLLKIDLPPASDILAVDQFIASFLEQVQKDISLGALDPSEGEAAVEEYVQALHLPEKVAELTIALQQTPAAAAAVASRASAESNNTPSEHTDPVANSPTTNEGNELYPTETTSLLQHIAADTVNIGTLYEG
jgi:hypothetical protein